MNKKIISSLLVFTLSLISCSHPQNNNLSNDNNSGEEKEKKVPFKGLRDFEFYQQQYQLTDKNQKLLNNRGDGFEELYGLRNVRYVLNGLLYRGGANNKFHRSNRRDNMNPLQKGALTNLCKQGFSKAIYLYHTNFKNAPKSASCTDIHGKKNTIKYLNLVAHKQDDVKKIVKIVHESIMNNDAPLYAHCWNGWHASGFVSAVSLMQFCGYSTEEAVQYWDENTDGHNTHSRYESMRKKIRNYTIDPTLLVPEDIQKVICQ